MVAGLLLLLFYTFTVLCTYLFSGLYDQGYLDYDYFGRLDFTFITLFQMPLLSTKGMTLKSGYQGRYAQYI